jgi:hypothetical protein
MTKTGLLDFPLAVDAVAAPGTAGTADFRRAAEVVPVVVDRLAAFAARAALATVEADAANDGEDAFGAVDAGAAASATDAGGPRRGPGAPSVRRRAAVRPRTRAAPSIHLVAGMAEKRMSIHPECG